MPETDEVFSDRLDASLTPFGRAAPCHGLEGDGHHDGRFSVKTQGVGGGLAGELDDGAPEPAEPTSSALASARPLRGAPAHHDGESEAGNESLP